MTPIRHQYLQVKRQHPDAIVLFRLGDFYEAFDEDAKIVSRELEIVLTSREMGKGVRVPMAGIPHHALENYLARLIRRGHRVAICEQLGEPTAGGLVPRQVVRVVTPGTVLDPHLLEQKANNYLAALLTEGETAGLAYADITTGEFATAQFTAHRLPGELERLSPAEILIPEGPLPAPLQATVTRVSPLDEEEAHQLLLEHFGVASLEPYGCQGLPLAIRAAAILLRYIQETQKGAVSSLTSLATYPPEGFMHLDHQTRRNLEVFEGSHLRPGSLSLLSLLDFTRTPMGGRLLRKWLGQPLLDLKELESRQEGVAAFAEDHLLRSEVSSILKKVGDLERLLHRIERSLASPREVATLARSLEEVGRLRQALEKGSPRLASLAPSLKPCPEIVELVSRAINEEASLGEGAIKPGFLPELDGLRQASQKAREYLANLERQEKERTGIKSLKVSYNKVFGYYIEVTNPHLPQVPQDYIRKQTLIGAERFITPELKEYEALILNAQERMAELEGEAFRQVCRQIGDAASLIQETAAAIANMDVLASLAEAAVTYNYCRPQLTKEDVILIKEGRHPVVERALEEPFVPNDTYLSSKEVQLIVLTGPNMAGKSTYLRQVALIILLAQIGSFVPARSATIGLVDRIFTRVGLQDDLATGRSTFMVEMMETAHILHNARPRSLIILDEIGRGTSTYDGLAIARAVVEYIHNHPRLGAKTLFATHYHELTELAQYLPRVRNFHMAVAEEGDKVVFLRCVIPGGADRSYGIHVAQLAGLPRPVVQRAQEALATLEKDHQGPRLGKGRQRQAPQLPLFPSRSPLLEELAGLDIDSLTPLEAITKLYELHKKAKEE